MHMIIWNLYPISWFLQLSDLQDHLQLLPKRKPDHPASQAGCLKRQQSQKHLQTKNTEKFGNSPSTSSWFLNFYLPKITWKPPNNLLILVDKLPLQQLGSVHQVSTMQNELCHCDLQPVAMNVGLKPNITETNIYSETFSKTYCATVLDDKAWLQQWLCVNQRVNNGGVGHQGRWYGLKKQSFQPFGSVCHSHSWKDYLDS